MKKNNKNDVPSMQRRSFLKGLLTVGAGAVMLPIANFKSALVWANGLPMLAESDPTAQALGYYANGAKVDVKKWTKKAGPEGKTQTCSGCQFYTANDKKSGKCQLFPNNLVSSNGWCNSWMKKA